MHLSQTIVDSVFSCEAVNRLSWPSSFHSFTGGITHAVAKGQLTSATSYTGSVAGKPGLAYVTAVGGYDALYNPTSTTVSIPLGAPAFGGASYKVGMSYTATGSLSERTLPAIAGLSAETVRVGYDGIGNVASVSGAFAASSSLYGMTNYTPLSQLSTVYRGFSSGNQLYTTFGYDPGTGVMNQVIDTSFIGAGSATESNQLYKRNAAGDVTSVTTTGSAGAETQCFAYGAFHALAEAWTPKSGDCGATRSVAGLGGAAPYWASYAVDPATGNRLKATSHTAAGDAATAYTYPAAGTARPHAVSTVAGGAYGYDASGNTTARPGQTLSWNESGKLSTVTAAGVSQSRVYDAEGSLLLQVDGKTGSTLYLGETEVTQASGGAVSAVRSYSLGDIPLVERSAKSVCPVRLCCICRGMRITRRRCRWTRARGRWSVGGWTRSATRVGRSRCG